jgi:DNA-binding MarR family transcriptional regulator
MAVKQIINTFNLEPGIVVRAERHVLLELANFADGRKGVKINTCFPGIETLAERTGYAEGTISKAISSLIEKGFIIKQRRFNTSNYYKVVVPKKKK